MQQDPERRTFIDPRYVTWEAFDRRAREVDERFGRDERQAELQETEVNRQLAEQSAEIVRLRIASARQAVYISLVQLGMTAAATAWITFLLQHR